MNFELGNRFRKNAPRNSSSLKAAENDNPSLARHEPVNWKRIRATKSSCTLLSRANPKDVGTVQNWESGALKELESSNAQHTTELVRLLFDASTYYENIGQIKKSLAIAQRILIVSEGQNDPSLTRRAHNSLGALFSRVCDFKSSFFHTESAYRLAIQTSDPIGILASLSNAAANLYAAGLKNEAREIALKASHLPSTNANSSYLHLMNSNNGMRYSHATGDIEAADHFYAISVNHYNKDNKIITDLTRAYFESFTAEHLISKGEAGQAIDLLEQALHRSQKCDNVRIASLLMCALVRGYAATGDISRLTGCESSLQSLLCETKLVPIHHEEILAALIQINILTQGSKAKLTRLLEMRREYSVVTRHAQFFEAVARKFAYGNNSAVALEKPVQRAPDWLRQLSGINEEPEAGAQWLSTLSDSSSLRWYGTDEGYFRSWKYEVAEEWAVAAEYRSGGSWQQCFGVGELVRVIALRLGFTPHKATATALAARICDIGKIAVCDSPANEAQEILLNEFGKLRKQSEVGTALLGGSSDSVIQLGCNLAYTYGEWWNGCGGPQGLRGEGIPVEARICAAAKTFLSLILPKATEQWSLTSAIQQIKCMSGVQLDPDIVSILIEIVCVNGGEMHMPCEQDPRVLKNQFLRAKSDLFEVLEL